jgi:hypothetical protein
MPDPIPPPKIDQVIQAAFDAPRGPRRSAHQRGWVEKLATPTTLAIAGLGIYAVVAPSFNRCRGATLSAKLRFEQRSQEVQSTINGATTSDDDCHDQPSPSDKS